ncbi:pumilio and CPL domain-containing protein penguin [Haemaphysalis longicornis]|uniref:PUM-HD domain-containing protein n=1 Tax=Haemaphysalis longicornis TaxID=44386 RepID=A0A9J6FDT5_HAELO|nr:hypothetical protein HPB48_002937 [Haemaphysalis longicornis]
MKVKKAELKAKKLSPKGPNRKNIPKQKGDSSFPRERSKTGEADGKIEGKYTKGTVLNTFPPAAGKRKRVNKLKHRNRTGLVEAADSVGPEEKTANHGAASGQVSEAVGKLPRPRKHGLATTSAQGSDAVGKLPRPGKHGLATPGQVSDAGEKLPRPEKRGLSNDDHDGGEPKRIKLVEMKKKERKQVRKRNESKFFEISKAAKRIWEDLRLKSCTPERRAELLAQLTKIVKGNIKQLIFAHDTSRVIECMDHLGTAVHRNMIFDEVKDIIVPMTKSKYAKFMVKQILRNGTAEQKEHVIRSCSTHVVGLLYHVNAADILETIYNEHANALQRSWLLQEFYSRELALFKKDKVITLADALAESADPAKMIENLKEALMKIVDKPVIRHSIVHHVILEFFKSADPSSRSEMIRALGGSLVEMLHTKDGSRVAMQCIWHGTAKDRKAIIKSFKTYAAKIAREEHGHMVLLAIFDCVDDTKLVESVVIAELLKEPLDLLTDPHGQRVLAYLIAPRDRRVFHPQVVDILKEGDSSSTSKKDREVRRQELHKAAAQALPQVIADNAEELLTCSGPTAIALHVILTNIATSEAASAFRGIAKLLNEVPYKVGKDQEGKHLFDESPARFFLKKMAAHDKNVGDKGQDSFCGVVADIVTEETMSTWIGCHFGALFLVMLLETGITKAIARVKAALQGKNSLLKKSEVKTAELLLRKLQNV